MRKTFTYTLITLLVLGSLSISGCKDFKKFKESRATLKQNKKDAKKARENTEVIAEQKTSDKVEEKTNEKETKSDSLFFSYERTPCFGRCPIFKLKVYHGGFATYDGTNFVDNIGYFKATLSQEKIDEIKSSLKKANYFWLDDAYDNEHVTDLPSRIIEVNNNGKYKKVIGRYQFPEELKQLYKELDNLFEPIEWEPHSEN